MPEQPNTPLQEQLAQLRREHLLDAATRVFAEKGYHRATIRDVAKAAGVADGTIYNYFENKTALLMGILHRVSVTERRAEDFSRSASVGLEDFLRAYTRQRFEELDHIGVQVFQVLFAELLTNAELRQQYYQQAVEPSFALAEERMRLWVSEGPLAGSDPQLLARALAGMVVGVLLLRVLGDQELEAHWKEIPDLIATLLLNGLRPQQGEEA
jgi:AcrR family transcriptional regulator